MYIITSKTRRRSPNGKQMIIEHPQADERRIVSERQAERKLASGHGWADPKPAPSRKTQEN